MDPQTLMRQQVELRTNEIRKSRQLFQGLPSWIRYIRKALGMSVPQLAKRMNLKPSSVYQLERYEEDNRVTLKKMKEVAEALNCDFFYALVPRVPLQQVIEEQALRRSKELEAEVHIHMEIEDQALSEKGRRQQVEALVKELMESKSLWEGSG